MACFILCTVEENNNKMYNKIGYGHYSVSYSNNSTTVKPTLIKSRAFFFSCPHFQRLNSCTGQVKIRNCLFSCWYVSTLLYWKCSSKSPADCMLQHFVWQNILYHFFCFFPGTMYDAKFQQKPWTYWTV